MMYELFCSGYAAASESIGVFESLTEVMMAANEDFLAKSREMGMLLSLEWNDQGAKVFSRVEDQDPELMWGYPMVRA